MEKLTIAGEICMYGICTKPDTVPIIFSSRLSFPKYNPLFPSLSSIFWKNVRCIFKKIIGLHPICQPEKFVGKFMGMFHLYTILLPALERGKKTRVDRVL